MPKWDLSRIECFGHFEFISYKLVMALLLNRVALYMAAAYFS